MYVYVYIYRFVNPCGHYLGVQYEAFGTSFLTLILLLGRELLCQCSDDILSSKIVIFDLPLLQVIWLSPDYVTQDPMSHSKLLNHSDSPDKTFAKLLPWEFFAWLVEHWMSASLIIYRFIALHHLDLCLIQWAQPFYFHREEIS